VISRGGCQFRNYLQIKFQLTEAQFDLFRPSSIRFDKVDEDTKARIHGAIQADKVAHPKTKSSSETTRSQMCDSETDLQEIWMGDRWRADGPAISIPSGSITLGDLLETADNQSDHHFWSIVKNVSDGEPCGVSISICARTNAPNCNI
jgi:hypothetical protein